MTGGNIFLSYRRSDTAGHAGRLFPGRVFRDVTGIPYGADFADEIARRLGRCQALVVLIGRDWLTATDERGRRRLDDEGDLVRLEIATGLRGTARVIPVLVEGTGTWERGTSPRVVFFRTRLYDGSEVTARLEVQGEHAGGYRAAHSYYGDLIMRRAAPR